jgi:hypothetical protein
MFGVCCRAMPSDGELSGSRDITALTRVAANTIMLGVTCVIRQVLPFELFGFQSGSASAADSMDIGLNNVAQRNCPEE